MKRFNEWSDRMDEKLKNIDWKEILYFLWPISVFFKRKPKNETGKAFIYDTKLGNPIQIRSTKNMSNMEMLYRNDFFTSGAGNASTSGAGNASTSGNFAMDMYKAGIARDICEQIMKGDLIDWATEDTQNGTQITGRIIVNKF
jgi:hypothetical protein